MVPTKLIKNGSLPFEFETPEDITSDIRPTIRTSNVYLRKINTEKLIR